MALLRTTFVLALGVAAGFALALWWLDHPPQPQALSLTPADASPPSLAPQPAIESAIVTIATDDADGRLRDTANGIVIGANDIVIAKASTIAAARRVVINTRQGDAIAVADIWASDDVYDLVALKPARALHDVHVLLPFEGAGSLQPGRVVALLSATGARNGEVISAALRDGLGAYYYDLSGDERGNPDAAAIIDPQSLRLLGLVRSQSTSGTHVAPRDRSPAAALEGIDAAAITSLLNVIDTRSSMSLSEFSQYYFDQTGQGRLAKLRELLARKNYTAAIEHGKAIINLDAYTQTHVTPLLIRTYADATRQQLDARRYRNALALLDDAAQWIPATDSLLLQRAEALGALNDYDQALTVLQSMQQPDFNRIRIMLLEHAIVAGSRDNHIRLLLKALETDPEFAPYYRILGEQQAADGQLVSAVSSLEQAIELDNSMARELAPLLERLRARRHSVPLAEIPIRREGGTFIVDVRINGQAQPLQFILDTGASYTAIRTETALRLGMNNIFFGAPVIELQTANGPIFTTTATLQSVEVAGARVDNVETVILESMGRWDGLLGQSFLRHFDVQIDRTRNVISFNRRLDE